jgi:DNA-binding CsgD family transcriptional regulator
MGTTIHSGVPEEALTRDVTIGDALYISVNTVKSHVASLFNKLGVDTRAQLVALVAERGLL